MVIFMLPKVIIYNTVSLDGRNTGFEPDLELYYQIAREFSEDATLVGSHTFLNPMEEIPEEDESAFKPPNYEPDDKRPILVVPDSKGRVRTWHCWRSQPYWRDWIVLVTESTPKDFLEYLEKRYIKYMVVGKENVNLKAALEKLSEEYNVKTVRVDSGGTLNGVLLREGLASEVNLLVHPQLMGEKSSLSFYQDQNTVQPHEMVSLKLVKAEKVKDDILLLRYEVVG
jgi:2,5-diamino-6-(ribosylamino)-4(3H)-pyrimidinone 5'-phosphate reductase